MNTTIIIPAYNEGTAKSEPYLERVHNVLHDKGHNKRFIDSCKSNIFRTLAVLRTETKLPIIVIDDGSNDDTSEEVIRFQKGDRNSNITLLKHHSNYGKWAALLTAIDNLSTDVASILLTDADMIIPNNIIDRLSNDFYRYKKIYKQFGMSIACCWSKQSRWVEPAADFAVDNSSGTRMLCLEQRKNVLHEHNQHGVHDLICWFPYGLETILNNLFITIIASSTITSNPAEELPRFLPACRHYTHFDHINEQICGAQNMYYKHLQDKKQRNY